MICLCATSAIAQVRPDSAQRDTARVTTPPLATPVTGTGAVEPDSVMRARILARSDSARQAYLADTIMSPVAGFEMPSPALDLTQRLRFDREQILSSSALDLSDLLDRVQGVTTFRSGWLAGIHAAAFNGDARRIRFFLDGIELDGSSDPRGGGAIDLTGIPLWTLDELVIERGPGEIRVWMRTLAATNVTPFSRVDIFTGDLNTNAFRGFLARRWRNGIMFQAGGQQVATQTGRVSGFSTQEQQRRRGDGSVQLFMARLGWARGRWSFDAYGQGGARERDATTARDTMAFASLPSYKGSSREGYLRFGYGDTLSGAWSQMMIHAGRTKLEPTFSDDAQPSLGVGIGGSTEPRAQPNTVTARTQQLIAVGYRGRRWSVSLSDRVRPFSGKALHAPAVRGNLKWRTFALGAWMEQAGPDSTSRNELTAQYRPSSWMVFNVARASRTPVNSTGRIPTATLRAEVAVRYRELWLSGGLLRDDEVSYSNIELLSLPGVLLKAPPATGILVGAHGRIYKDVQLSVQSLRWNTGQFSRPPQQVRAELALQSEWRSRFPTGEFGINARVWYELRDGTPFFYGALGNEGVDIRTTEKSQVVTAHLEIRIQRGTLFYQFRNLTGGQYEQIRGINMPPVVQLYGMRWEFWN